MTAGRRSFLSILGGFVASSILCALTVVVLMSTFAPAAASPPVVIDPVVTVDHADPAQPPCLERGVPLVNPPPTVLKPGWWARTVALGRDLGKRTGGAGVVLGLGAIVERVRDWRPRLKRGVIGKFTYGLWGASLWCAATLAAGATWATTLSGVVLALITGAVWAAVPKSKADDTSTAATP